MSNQANTSKKSDVILSVTALIVVSGLCLIGAHSLYTETVDNTTGASTSHFVQLEK